MTRTDGGKLSGMSEPDTSKYVWHSTTVHVARITRPHFLPKGDEREILMTVEQMIAALEECAISLTLLQDAMNTTAAVYRDLLPARPGWPRAYLMRVSELHARSFVNSVFGIRQRLELLNKENRLRPRGIAELERIKALVPNLKDVRDTLAHTYERERRRGGQGKNNKPFLTPDGLVLGVLKGQTYVTTGPTGQRCRIDITEGTFTSLQEVVQNVIDSFEWQGVGLLAYPSGG
jgi:hypothetical protein